ncbi:YiaA/YiaB family inner membrane protein [Nonomuraea antimicrobica]|uniref:YiaA/YiaB family inner membrane protein n=1 Tax=Nonomuraea antimicrobica TaxID=561173 RepID=A0ABP7CJN8_9ACTN
MTKPIRTKQTAAFYVQALLSFAVSLASVVIALVYLPTEGWIRAFLGLGLLYVVTSTITLCKVVRDRHELAEVSNRVDQARLDKLLSEHDPYKVDA